MCTELPRRALDITHILMYSPGAASACEHVRWKVQGCLDPKSLRQAPRITNDQKVLGPRTLRPWGHSGVLKVSVHAIMPTSFWPTGRLTAINGLGCWCVLPGGITSSSTSTSRPDQES